MAAEISMASETLATAKTRKNGRKERILATLGRAADDTIVTGHSHGSPSLSHSLSLI